MRTSDWSSDVCSSDLQSISNIYQYPLVRDARGRGLVDHRAALEAFEAEGARERVRLAGCHDMREAPAARRHRLEPAGAPAAVDVKPADRGRANNRRRVMDDVDDSGPLAQATHARKLREEFEHPGGRAFHPRQITALPKGQIKIEPAAEEKFALVQLAEVGARRGGQDHDRKSGG